MTSGEKKTTETYVPKPILVGEKKIFFFHLSRIFRDKSKMAKIPKKTKTNFDVIGRLIELFLPASAPESPKIHQKGRINLKNLFRVILDHLKKKEFFRFWPLYLMGKCYNYSHFGHLGEYYPFENGFYE